jgi:arsenate reductase (glutaredoxin)
MADVTIYHNPDCATSRNTLALIRNAGVEPQVIEYLKHPPARDTLKELIARAGLTVRGALRIKGTPYHDLGLDDPALADDQLLDAMMAHPILINRPLVVTPWGVRLSRPSEVVLDILPLPQQGPFRKEDGDLVIDEAGRRAPNTQPVPPVRDSSQNGTVRAAGQAILPNRSSNE